MTEKIGCVQHDCAECVARLAQPNHIEDNLAMVQPEREPTIAAAINGADAVGNKIDGYEAAKVYAAMQRSMRFETVTPPLPVQPEQKPATTVRFEDNNGAGRLRPEDCVRFGADGRPAAVWVGNVRYTPEQPQRQPLTDEQIAALMPKPDGTAEANSVWVKGGDFPYQEYDVVDAWSMPLVTQAIRAVEAAHGIKP